MRILRTFLKWKVPALRTSPHRFRSCSDNPLAGWLRWDEVGESFRSQISCRIEQRRLIIAYSWFYNQRRRGSLSWTFSSTRWFVSMTRWWFGQSVSLLLPWLWFHNFKLSRWDCSGIRNSALYYLMLGKANTLYWDDWRFQFIQLRSLFDHSINSYLLNIIWFPLERYWWFIIVVNWTFWRNRSIKIVKSIQYFLIAFCIFAIYFNFHLSTT